MSRQGIIIIYLFLLALIIRLVSLAVFGFIDTGGGTDSVTYLLLAKNLFSGNGFTEFGVPHTIHHPLYPILIGLVLKIVGDAVMAAHLVSVLAGAALVIPVYLLGKHLFGLKAGMYSGICVAVFPILVYGSDEAFSESLYTFLLISGIAIFWVAFRKQKVAGIILAGMVIGFAFLTHPLGIMFLLALILFLFFAQLLQRFRAWKRFLINIFGLLLGFCVICFPFWKYIHGVTGKWQLTGTTFANDISLLLGQARGMPPSEVVFHHMENLYYPSKTQFHHESIGFFKLACSQPMALIELVRYNLIDGFQEVEKSARLLGISTWLLMTGLVGVVILLAYSLVKGKSRGKNIISRVFLAMLFLPSLVFIMVSVEHRYIYPFVPLVLIAISKVAADWHVRVVDQAATFRRYAFYGVLTIAMVFMLVGSSRIIYRKWAKIGIPYEYKIMGDWIKSSIPGIQKEKVMMARLGISYYAGCQWNVFYWGDYPGLITYMNKRGIRYLVIDDYALPKISPGLHFLLEDDPPPSGFRMLKEFKFDGRKIKFMEYCPEL